MSINNFLPFCPTDSGTNLLTQTEYAAAADRTAGNQPGIASSKLNNKALRQANYVVSQLAQYMADSSGTDLLDNNTPATLLAQINGIFGPIAMNKQVFTTGSGTFNKTYVFRISSGSATLGATYTNNSITFTVVRTVAASTQVYMTGSAAPFASGTLTKTSGTGDSTLTFFTVRAPLYLEVIAIGGGGGGGGAGLPGSDGNPGGDTTFGSLTASGGGAGGNGNTGNSQSGGTGGGTSLSSIPGFGLTGSSGGQGAGGLVQGGGGNGGGSAFGTGGAQSAGSGQDATSPGTGGGGMSGSNASYCPGSGGGAGGYIQALIYSPSATYPYSVGGGGSGGSGNAGSFGGDGAAGIVIVNEYYQ